MSPPARDEPLVSIVILNWNGLEDTKECLQSIREQTYRNFEVIVVDNGSHDGSAAYFSGVADIQFIPLKENLGFTGGHIEGYKQARGDYIALLNNDLWLHPAWLAEVVATMRDQQDAGAVAGKLYKWDADNPVGREENEYYTWQEVDNRNGITRMLLTGREQCWVDSLSGAALLVRRAVIDVVGYLDNDFFAYYEETDLIARMLRAGYRAYFTPGAKAWHKIASSSEGGSESEFNLYLKHRNRYAFAIKNFDESHKADFLRCYRKDYLRALVLRRVVRRVDFNARVAAYRWARKNARDVAAKRDQVLSLGDSYIDKLRTFRHDDVTVVIPCYNYGKYVGEAIESALSQTLPPKAIIIIDDGSTDNSLEIIERYKSNELIQIIEKQNEGTVATKNLGLKLVDTHWVIFLDADDKLPPNYIEATVDVAFREKTDVVYTDFRYFGAKDEHVVVGEMSRIRLLKENFIHNSALIETTVARMVGGYKAELKQGLEDWELYLSIAKMNARFSYAKDVVFLYRQHEGGVSRNELAHEHHVEIRAAISRYHWGVRLFRYWAHFERVKSLPGAVIRKIRQRQLLAAIARRIKKQT